MIRNGIKEINRLYLIALFIGTSLELMYYWLYESLFINLHFLVIIFIFTTRFLSGLGIFSSLSLFAMYVLKYFSGQFKGNKRLARIFVIGLNLLMILFFALLVIYSAYSFVIRKFNLATSIIGILMVVFSYYIIPIWKANYKVKINENMLDKMKDFFKGLKLDIIKGYYEYLSKEYLKSYSIDYVKFRIKWDKFRYRTSIYIILVLAISSLVLPLFLILMITLIAKIFFLKKTMLGRLDYAIIASYSLVAIYVLLSAPTLYFMDNIVVWTIPYLIGLSVSFIAYVNAMLLHERFK